MFDCEMMAGAKTDTLIHELLCRVDRIIHYSSDKLGAKALAKEVGFEVTPMHQPNHALFCGPRHFA